MSVVKRPAIRGYWERFFNMSVKHPLWLVKGSSVSNGFFIAMAMKTFIQIFQTKFSRSARWLMLWKKDSICLYPLNCYVLMSKSRSTLKQYSLHMPKKWGCKFYVLTSLCPDALIYNFEAHTGAIDMCSVQPDLQASGNIVVKLLANIPRHKGHKLFIDNWYTSVPLATTLMNQRIALVGTGRANRLRNYIMPSEKDMKKERRGTIPIKTS